MEEKLDCRTRYPVVLIHGAGFRDLKWPVYWGRIPAALEKRGARIFYGLQDSWGSVETNAEAVARRIDGILAESGAQKVNLIAHSKGGLDARMAVSSFGCGGKVASVTTVATPHHGSKTVDRLFALPRSFWNTAAFAVDNWIRVVGDKEPDFLRQFSPMTNIFENTRASWVRYSDYEWYTNRTFHHKLEKAGMVQSMSRVAK